MPLLWLHPLTPQISVCGKEQHQERGIEPWRTHAILQTALWNPVYVLENSQTNKPTAFKRDDRNKIHKFYLLLNKWKKKSSILIVNYLLRISSAQVSLKWAIVEQQIFLVDSGPFLKHF